MVLDTIWNNYSQIVGAMIYYLIAIIILIIIMSKVRSPVPAIAFYIASYTISQYAGSKLTIFHGWAVPAGTITFTATLVFMDIIVVYYGLSLGRTVIYMGFLSQILLYTVNTIVYYSPSAFPWVESINPVYMTATRIAIASPIAYLICEMVNAQLTWMYRWVWWKRTIYSDPIALIIDTIVFIPIAFYGAVPLEVLIEMIISLSTLKITLIPLNLFAIYTTRKIFQDYLGYKVAEKASDTSVTLYTR